MPERWLARPPATGSLETVRRAAAGCRACPLWERATQTVFGEGPEHARFLLVGEQPGNEEDLAGRPFVGPAGRRLERALAEAGIARGEVYVTNAVKHFKWEPRGKRRLHQKPTAREIAACRPWLEAEIALVMPEVLICLGASASRAIFGAAFRVTRERGQMRASRFCARTFATIHPSALLRIADPVERRREHARFVDDLRAAGAAGATARP